MVKVIADNYPMSINQYVPDMEFAADVVQEMVIQNLGAPTTLDVDGIIAVVASSVGTTARTWDSSDFAVTFDGSSTSLTSTAGLLDATFGRTITCTGNASTDQVVTVSGRDYLGQRMQENITLAGAATIQGKKAFKFIDGFSATAGSGGTTIGIGWGDLLGLPYKAEVLLSDTEDKVAAAGTITAGIDTDPQTITTGDPRGTFTPASATNGSIVYEVRYICDNTDLHGVEQFNG